MFKLLARLLSHPFVASWLIRRYVKEKNVYYHIVNPNDPSDVYMGRWWILKRHPWFNFCIRLHHIKRADLDENMHSHPFNYRTFVIKNAYVEERPDVALIEFFGNDEPFSPYQKSMRDTFMRSAGQTVQNDYGSFHRISWVHPEGVWTIFAMWGGAKDDWGFMTSNGYIHKDEYFRSHAEQR